MDNRIVIGVLIVLVAVLAVVLIQPVGQETGKVVLPSIATQKQTVKIGVVLPLTGAQANYGQGIREGLELAASEINNNPQLDFNVVLVFEDTASETKNSVTAAQKLIAFDNVSALISGPSQYAVAIAPIAEKQKIVLLSMASHASSLNNAGEFVFKNDDTFANLANNLALVVAKQNYKRVAIVFAQYNDATLEAKDTFKQKFESLGEKVVAVEGFDKGTKDFHSIIAKILAANPDAIFLDGQTPDTIPFLNQLKETGVSTQVFSNPAVEDSSVLKGAASSADGVIFATFNGYPSDGFVAKVQSSFGHAPLRWTTEAYDGLKMIASALEKIDGNIFSEALRAELSEIKEYSGESGTAIFDANGNAHRSLFIKQIKDGKFVPFD